MSNPSDEIVESAVVASQEKPVRLSDLRGIFETISTRKGLKKALDKGLVLLDGQKAETGDWVSGGETLSLKKELGLQRVLELSLEVLYEDDHLAVVNKPAGMVVSGNKHRTLENALPFNLKQSPLADKLVRPQAIHRLDYPTSGVLLVGKTRSAVTLLNQQFEQRQIEKHYLALTLGETPVRGLITIPIAGKSARTYFECLQSAHSEQFGKINFVKLRPVTGRRHQLRQHMAFWGTPILGDKQYGQPQDQFRGIGLHLHASSLMFKHPITEEALKAESKVPKGFKKFDWR